jgi:3'-5' exoribonuclease
MPRIFLKDRKPGDHIEEEIFLLSGKQLSTTQAGKPFIKANISDKSKSIPARMWNAPQGAFNAMPEGGFLRLSGRVENYQDNLQFIIDRFWMVEPHEIVLDDLIAASTKDTTKLFAQLKTVLETIKHPQLAAIVRAYLADEKLMADFLRAPAAMSMHHAYIGGLLEHTLNACEVADAVCKFYPLLNREIVVTGIFIHDLAKTTELAYASAFGYTDEGQLVGHIAQGVVWVQDKAQIAAKELGQPIDPKLVMTLQHIVLSHHGTAEFGAIKPPATPEAMAVHLIENMDAKMQMILEATRSESAKSDATFTDFHKGLGVRLYKVDPTQG